MSTPQTPTNPTPGGTAAGSAARLNWSVVSEANSSCYYTHTFAETPFGRFLLTWKSWKDDPGYGFDETPWGDVVYLGWNSVESAQQWAEDELQRRAALCLPALRSAAEKALAAWDGWQGSLNKKPQNLDALLAAMADLRTALNGQSKTKL